MKHLQSAGISLDGCIRQIGARYRLPVVSAKPCVLARYGNLDYTMADIVYHFISALDAVAFSNNLSLGRSSQLRKLLRSINGLCQTAPPSDYGINYKPGMKMAMEMCI